MSARTTVEHRGVGRDYTADANDLADCLQERLEGTHG
jgi:hypothetical protein